MPIPKRKKGEHEKDFIPRCVSFLVGEGKESSQASAICYQQLSIDLIGDKEYRKMLTISNPAGKRSFWNKK